MTTHSKFLLAALTVALALCLGVSAASALRSLSITGESTVIGEGIIDLVSAGGRITIRCPLTILKTISRAIPKTSGILLGRVTRIAANSPEPDCSSSLGELQRIIILAPEAREGEESTKCRLFFESIVGILPAITGINAIIKGCLIGFETRVELIGVIRCLYKEDGRGVAIRESVEAGGRLTRIEIGRNTEIVLEGQSGFCARELELQGDMTVRSSPSVRLV
jgi:hypothetical protein